MRVLVFSSSKTVIPAVEGLGKSKLWDLEIRAPKELAEVLKSVGSRDFVYADVNGMEEADRKKLFKTLTKKDVDWGVLDPKGGVDDPSEVFFSGAKDYVGKGLLAQGLTAARMKKVLEFASQCRDQVEEEEASVVNTEFRIPSGGWSGIQVGEEYTFSLLLIQVDQGDKLKQLVGESRLTKLREDLKNLLAAHTAEVGGQLWMFMDLTALVIVPFDGKSCPVILNSLKFLMQKNIYCYEYLRVELPMSFRLALHIGNVEYRAPGKTGTIVSDAVNSVFHLGQKYAEDNTFYIAGDAIRYVPDEFKDLFLSAGDYEGRKIWRMKRLV